MILVLVLILLEIFEVWWQRADTLEEVLYNGYYYYRKSIFIYFIMHPAFSFTLFVILYTEIFNWYFIAILLFKTMDMFFKLTLMRGIFEDRGDINMEIRAMMKEPLNYMLLLTGLGIYPFLLLYGLQ